MKDPEPFIHNREQARAAYHYLKNMLDSIADPVFVKNKAHQWVDGNKAFWELMGGTPEEFSGKTDYDIFPREEADIFWQQDNKVFTSGQPDINEEFLTDRQGVRHVISTKKAIFLNEQGEEVLVGVIRDITAQKQLEALNARVQQAQLEEAVRENETRLRAIHNQAAVGFAQTDLTGHFLTVNPRYCDIVGRSEQELMQLRMHDISHPEDMERNLHLARNMMQTGESYVMEKRYLRPDGSVVWVNNNVSLIHKQSGEPWLIIAVTQDITDRKLAVAALRKKEEQYKHLFEASEHQRRIYDTVLSNTADYNYVFDLEGRFTYANKALLDFWKKPLHEVIGRTFFELDYPASLAEELHAQIQQVIITRQPVKGESSYATSDGVRAYEHIFQPVLGDGNVEAVAGSTRDITDLKEADRRKDEFLAMLAHELRNPLAPMRNALQVMRLCTIKVGADEAMRAQAQGIIERQLEHMTHLVDDLMDVSRITQGKIELKRECINLREVIQHAVESAQPLMDAHDHRLSIDLPEEELWLTADFARVSQIFSNLLNNAAKYTNDGGQIFLGAQRDVDNSVVLSVRDNGIGISADMLETVFDMFHQVDSSLERSHGGLGIGLTLVKNLVELQGGTVTAKSDGVGSGSEFHVRFPLVGEPVIAKEARLKSTDAPEVCRVLIVDDNVPSAKTLGWMMELSGHEARLAHSAAEAMTVVADYRPQVLLLDIGLPGMNGYELCAAMRALPQLEHSLFIAQTGWGQQEHRARSKAAGFHHHLVKPVELSMLQQIMNDFMRQANPS